MLELPKLNRFQTAAISVAAVVALSIGYVVWVPLHIRDTALRDVEIKQGFGVVAVAHTLKSAGLIRSSWGFILYVQAMGVDQRLQAGRYRFAPSMSLAHMVSMMVWGLAEPNDITVFIPEGENVWEIDERLTAAGLITEGAFARKYIHDEGYFFPDTYRFKPGATVDEIAQRMKWNFTSKVNPLMDRTTVTIASMLEKEGKTAEDKAIIAGIILRRIKIGMALQIDASVAYGACLRKWLPQSSTANCDVTHVPIAYEIGLDSEYNTYRRAGLPVGPIANPGLEAIEAARNPVTSDYLYYLSPRDGSRIIFSKTSAEHARNRRKYLGI
jgi:UPF0755 protein